MRIIVRRERVVRNRRNPEGNAERIWKNPKREGKGRMEGRAERATVWVSFPSFRSWFVSICDLFARVDVDGLDAGLALDVAAPVEFALAAFLDRRFVGVVTPTAAHQVASVHSGGCPVARPPVGSCMQMIKRAMSVLIFSPPSIFQHHYDDHHRHRHHHRCYHQF